MTFIDGLRYNFDQLGNVLVFFAPLFVFSAAISIALGFFVGERREVKENSLYLLFLCSLGVAVAYIQVGLRNDLIPAILPSIITVLAVLFQLIGRLKPELSAPLDGPRSFAGVACAFTMFMLSAHYFQKILPHLDA